jgi:hypothetical protein
MTWVLIVFMFSATSNNAVRLASFETQKECQAAAGQISKRFEKWEPYARPKSFCFRETVRADD